MANTNQSEMKWMSIESAPTDGEVVLLCTSTGVVYAGCWGYGTKPCEVADDQYPWLVFDPSTGGLNAYMEDRMARWMPLPPPAPQES